MIIEWVFPDAIGSSSSIRKALDTFATTGSLDDLQHMLEEHQQILLTESTSTVLCLTLAREQLLGNIQTVDDLLDYLHLLEDIRARGLQEAMRRLVELDEYKTIGPARAIEIITNALAAVEQTTYAFIWAELHSMRADSYRQRWETAQHEEDIEQALLDFTETLTVYSEETVPEAYAQNHYKRGLVYLQRVQSDPAQNIEDALRDFDCTLRILTYEKQAQDWASAHLLRGLAYIDRTRGEREENITHAVQDFEAALQFFTQQDFPQEWATLLKNRAGAYAERKLGDRKQNLEQAAADYEAILAVYTLEAALEDYRAIQFNLMQLYLELQQPEQVQRANRELRRAMQRQAEQALAQIEEQDSATAGQQDQDVGDTTAIASDLKSFVETKNWSELLEIVKQRRHLLLSQQAITLLTRQVLEVENAQSDGRSEFLRSRLQLLEDARTQGIGAAWQRFTSDQLDALQTFQTLQLIPSFEELSRRIASDLERYLTTPFLALMYLSLEEYRASKNLFVVPILEKIMSYLLSLKQGTTVKDEAPQQQEVNEATVGSLMKQAGYSFQPGMVRDFDYSDPFLMLILQEIPKLSAQQVATLMPFLAQMDTLLKSPSTPGMAEATTRLMNVIDRHNTPYLWAMLRYNRVIGCMNQPQANYKQAISDCHDVLSIFTREVTPIMWAHTRLIRAMVIMQPLVNQQSSITDENEQKQQLEQALADLDAALTVFTREKMPTHWALAIGTRGFTYIERERITRNMVENINKALADFDAALQVLDVEGTPAQRAAIYLYKGLSYFRLPTKDRKQTIEQAIANCAIALSVLPARMSQDETEQWAAVLMVRGLAYTERIAGERQQNIELALADFEAALTVYSLERDPQQWARAQANLGLAYLSRLMGDRRQNLEQAIIDFNKALGIFTKAETPLEWARTLTNRGICYQNRIAEERGKNQEQAIEDITASLTVFTETFKGPDRGIALMNRGSVYLPRIAGERRQNLLLARDDFDHALTYLEPDGAPQYRAMTLINRSMAHRGLALSTGLAYRGAGFRELASRILGQRQASMQSFLDENERLFEQAIEDLNEALTLLNAESTPYEWGVAMRERAQTYAFRLTGNFTGKREEYVQQAITDFSAALTVLSPVNTPADWATTHINRGLLYLQRVLDNHLAEADLGLADTEAAMSVFTRDIAPANYRRIVDIRASIFEKLGRWPEAHDALLAAREVQRDLVAASSSATRTDVIAEFALVDTYVRDARVLLHLDQPDLDEVVIALEEGRAQSLRAALDLDTLVPKEIKDAEAQQRARTFLRARNQWRKCQYEMLEPSTQQDAAFREMRSRNLQAAYASFIEARNAIRLHDNPDFMTPIPSMASIARALHAPGEALVYLVSEPSLDESRGMAVIVTQDMDGNPHVNSLHLPDLKEIFLFDLFELEENAYPKIRATETIERLGDLGLSQLARELVRCGIHRVTLITFGWLGLFPLSSAMVTSPNGNKKPLGELFEVTFAPGALAAARAHELSRRSRLQRPLLLMAGNPQPLPTHINRLPFATAEADTTQRIARAYGYPSAQIRYLKSREVTKENVASALKQAWYAHLAIHGAYQVNDPLRSRLVLAGVEAVPEKERNIFLNDVLDGTINLTGLRLLVLSACETAITDMNRTPDEVLGLAAGFLQAGVAGVVASLWTVDDHATYLLMSRFARLYLDPQGIWSPARALAEAQRWLREEATYSVLATYDPGLADEIKDMPTESRQRSLRLGHTSALHEIHLNAALLAQETPDELPYKDAQYWAAFIVTGC